MMLAPFVYTMMSLTSITNKPSFESGVKTCFTNTNKYSILQHNQYKLRENNIQRLSISIENPTLHHMKNSDHPTYILKYQLPVTNVETYLNENYCSPFILYTIINQCCNNLALYHGLLNCYHANTTIANFDMYDNHLCRLSDIGTDDKTLTLCKKIQDYDMLFDSYLEIVSQKNKHFIHLAMMFRKSFMNKMTPTILYPEEPNPPSPLLLTSISETSCISG
jgi:hypothetical protein